MSKLYYDMEYDREVNEKVVKNQYNWFTQQSWFNKTYEEFKKDNFTEIE